MEEEVKKMSCKGSQYLHSNKVFILLLLCIIMFNPQAFRASTPQMNLTDADKKEILSILFARELTPSQLDRVIIIYLSPRTDAKWMLEIPGIRFQKLTYEEEKSVSEYYEIFGFQSHRSYAELWLHKGNYLRKQEYNINSVKYKEDGNPKSIGLVNHICLEKLAQVAKRDQGQFIKSILGQLGRCHQKHRKRQKSWFSMGK